MDVYNLLSMDGGHTPSRPTAEHATHQHYNHPYPTRQAELHHIDAGQDFSFPTLNTIQRNVGQNHTFPLQPPSTRSRAPKIVQFRWHKARIPLRVKISPHDTVEGIISTVRNFYGLYEDAGISFEDVNGNVLVPQYENMVNNSELHLRVSQEQNYFGSPVGKTYSFIPSAAISPERPHLAEPFEMAPAHVASVKKRSVSPQHFGIRRTNSTRPSSKLKSHDHGDDGAIHGLSDSDAGSVSVSSSRRAKSDNLASAEISLDNIVEGGRRNGGKFLSSELPLFQPPQLPMTTSMSSASPQRRMQYPQMPSPFALPPTSAYNNPFPSPLSYNAPDFKIDRSINGRLSTQSFPHGSNSRNGSSGRHTSARISGNSTTGVLPTPDPTTVGSVISDEDVALQLMRLGDASNISLGRNSNSTMDDALSGKADAASSDDNEEEGELDTQVQGHHHPKRKDRQHPGPSRKRQKLSNTQALQMRGHESSEDEYPSDRNQPDLNAYSLNMGKKQKSRTLAKTQSSSSTAGKTGKTKSSEIPPSPYGNAQESRKNSSASSANLLNQYGPDEEDLSSKPRCQRCRKSKKGCDRQRPCQRCVDAGIGIEGCISEDEENGRKGRFGRVMGIAVKKSPDEPSTTESFHETDYLAMTSTGTGDKNKKRKR